MPAPEKQRISLCMIARDEEDYIGQCLASVRDLVHETIVVDTGSQDRTAEVAGSYGASVYHDPWQDDYSQHRNRSMSYAVGNWILVMDADEVIAERDIPRVKDLLRTATVDGFTFTMRNYEADLNLANITLNPHDYEEGGAYPGFVARDLIRLFRNDPGIRFSGKVHETVTDCFRPSGRTHQATGIPIHHYGKVREDRALQKKEHYLRLGEVRLQQNPSDPIAYKTLAEQCLEMGKPGRALEILDRGVGLFPNMLELRFGRGLALDRLGQPGKAQSEYQWVLRRQPGHLGARHNLAQMHYDGRRFERTIEVLRGGINAGLRHPAVYCLLGRAYDSLSNRQRALESFDRALGVQPDFPNVNCHKAAIFLRDAAHSAALAALAREIDIGGNLSLAYSMLGEMSLKVNDTDSAAMFFRKVVSIDPHHSTAGRRLQQLGAA